MINETMAELRSKRKKEELPQRPTDRLKSFTERSEEELIKSLLKKTDQSNEDIEESEYYEGTYEYHKKTNNLWDVILEDEIKYFDPTLSYEVTGYRPITETEGLDFDPAPFMEVGRTYERTGKYTAFRKGTKAYVDFWRGQIKRCVEGYTVGKYRITGDHYFFLNFYRMGIVNDKKKAGAGSEESFPFFTSKQYEFFHYIEICEYLKKDVVALKARAVGFSEIGACLGVRPFITTRKFRTVYTAHSETYVDAVLDKCWYQLNWLNNNTDGGMKRVRQKIDNIKQKRASKLDKEGVESGRFSEIEGIPADNPRKVRGDRCDRLMFEEFGSNPVSRTSWTQGTALVEIGGVRRGIKIGWGTGGDHGAALAGLAEMFNDPEAFGILPYKNNYSSDGTVQFTGFFIPAYTFMLGSDFTDNRGVTNISKAKAYYEDQRRKKSGQSLLEYCSEFCFTPEEALLRQGDNIFDSVELSNRITQIRIHKMGIKPRRVALIWDKTADDNLSKVKVFDKSDSNILIYEEPQLEGKDPFKNLYVAGIDSIDQGTEDSATQKDVSDFCIVIKKRAYGTQEPKYVAIYKERPRDIRTAYDTAMKLLAWYNCKAMLEHSKISIITYFKSKKKDNLFMKRPKSSLSDIKRGNSQMIGVPATETIIKHGLELINTYVNDYCYTIDSDMILEQLLNYSYENKRKYDIVAAMSMAEIADEELMGFNPKPAHSVEKEWKDFGWFINSKGYKQFGVIGDE